MDKKRELKSMMKCIDRREKGRECSVWRRREIEVYGREGKEEELVRIECKS